MKAKEYLLQLQKMDIAINQNIAWLYELKNTRKELKGVNYTSQKVKASRSNCADFEKTILIIMDMEQNINDSIDKFVDQKNEIIKQIQSLDNHKYMQLLYKRYVEYKSLEVIAVEMNYTYPYTRKLHRYALQKFEKKEQYVTQKEQYVTH
ncbi:hypothetical protein AAK894_13045 [Lachnospiraceae bacterium 46-61]